MAIDGELRTLLVQKQKDLETQLAQVKALLGAVGNGHGQAQAPAGEPIAPVHGVKVPTGVRRARPPVSEEVRRKLSRKAKAMWRERRAKQRQAEQQTHPQAETGAA